MKISVSSVRFEHHRDALGIGEATPRLSWRTQAPDGWRQAGYEVDVDGARFAVESAESVLVPWPAATLASRQRCDVRVRGRGADGTVSGWSGPARVEAGLLAPADWAARIRASPPRAR